MLAKDRAGKKQEISTDIVEKVPDTNDFRIHKVVKRVLENDTHDHDVGICLNCKDTSDFQIHKVVKRVLENDTHEHDVGICLNCKPLSPPTNQVLHKQFIILNKLDKDQKESPKIIERRSVKYNNEEMEKFKTTHDSKFNCLFRIPEGTGKLEGNSIKKPTGNLRVNQLNKFDQFKKIGRPNKIDQFNRPTVLTATMNDDDNNKTKVSKKDEKIVKNNREEYMETTYKVETETKAEENEQKIGNGFFDVLGKDLDFFLKECCDILQSLFPFLKPDTNREISMKTPLEFISEDSVDDGFENDDDDDELDDDIFPPVFGVDGGLLGEIMDGGFEKQMEDLWSRGNDDEIGVGWGGV
ncbi:uncharacterized protein LOC111052159 [Nilaparvata lugens]|uniref:uncharacterized protein LOC111052159 n=1 Tax=Nilaparvata lugens TaxID=108931 RepID=UPI00193D2A36|nr:uncharacterized protein LOC111052159 [Nilaparvata lugens]